MRYRHGSCMGPLHDYPMPDDETTIRRMTAARHTQGWKQVTCPACLVPGWTRPAPETVPAYTYQGSRA